MKHERSRRMRMVGVLAGIVLAVLASRGPARAADVAPERPLAIGAQLQPIVDGRLIAEMKGVRLTLHSPQPQEVAFRFDAPWEGPMSAYVTVLKDGPRFRMYYRGGGDIGREYTCLAESEDGVHWARPRLGLFEFDGSKENNIIWTGPRKAYAESHSFSPFIDANPAATPEQRYKAVTLGRGDIGGKTRNFLLGFTSSDGIHWRRLRDQPIITEGGFDSQNTAFWDSVQKQYVCYLRIGREGRRSIARATSQDFLTWTAPQPLDFGPTPLEHFYTNAIVAYFRAPQVYLGLPMRFVPPAERDHVGFERRKTDGLSDAVFMASHDGLHWERSFMEVWLRPGLDACNWGGAHGNSTPAWGLLQTSPTELSVWWSEHYGNYPEGTSTPQLRRGTLRLDGFVSVNAPYPGGEFITRPLVFAGRRLVLNCSTSAVGSIRVELWDAGGQPLPGYQLAAADEIWGDELERRVSWKGREDVSSLAGRPVRLRLAMKDADLYAFQFKD